MQRGAEHSGALSRRVKSMVATRLSSPKSWHEVPGIAADCDPSRRDDMIESAVNDRDPCGGIQSVG